MRVDLPALRVARSTLKDHVPLIRESLQDIGASITMLDFLRIIAALDHIIDDEFRSDENRGGS